jgi:ATP-dependent Clp protease adaptor protein ClpS
MSNHTLVDTSEVTEVDELTETRVKVKRPPMFKVVLLNDDYTPMDFVVEVLTQIFRKNQDEAIRIMLEVHNHGAGICGVYTRDVAETKADQTVSFARSQEHPLQCIVESV